MGNDNFDDFKFGVRLDKGPRGPAGRKVAVRIATKSSGRPSIGPQLRISLSADTIDKMKARVGDRFAIGINGDKTKYAIVPNPDGYVLQIPSAGGPKTARHVLVAANALGLKYGEVEDFENCDIAYRNGGIVLTKRP